MMKGFWAVILSAVTTCIVPTALVAEVDVGARQQFITCPVYRDTDAGPKSGCWLADKRQSGERFDVSGAISKPIIGKQILVEGVVSEAGSDQCGATVLDPVRVSVLDQNCPEHKIPAEGYSGKRFAPPKEVMQPLSVPRELPEGPYENKTFTILFNYNSSFLNYQYSEIILEKAALYIKASDPRLVRVTGYAATEPYVVSGRELREPKAVAKARAEQVALALRRLAPGSGEPVIDWRGNPSVVEHYADGLPAETRRRVEIHVQID